MSHEVTGRSYTGTPATEVRARQAEGKAVPLSGWSARFRPRTSPALDQARWYAAYTRSRHEKAVAEQLQTKGIETFLPIYKTMRHWKNGNHWVQLPLFPATRFAIRPD